MLGRSLCCAKCVVIPEPRDCSNEAVFELGVGDICCERASCGQSAETAGVN
jgi:hypothetical protein